MDVRERTTYTLKLDADEQFEIAFPRGKSSAKGIVTTVEFSVKNEEPGNSLVYLEGRTVTKNGQPGRTFRQWTGPAYQVKSFEQIPGEILTAMRDRGYAK